MTDRALSGSSVKLGLAVAWPAFWTGVPLKAVITLLMLAMGVQPWALPGLAVLLLLSIPIDIWAVTLSARTVFLDRLRMIPPAGAGLALWWQAALFSALYLPLAWFIQSETVAGAKAAAARIMEIELLKSQPVAERIGIELLLWSGVATLVAIALALGWLFIFGRLVRKQATASRPAEAPYETLVRQWDLLRVPADQPLMLTVFAATGVVLILLFWGFMPVTTPHPHEMYKEPPKNVEPPVKPAEALQKTEQIVAQADTALRTLEAKAHEEAKHKKGRKGTGTGKDSADAKAHPAGKGAKAQPAAATTDSHADDGHTHAGDGHSH